MIVNRFDLLRQLTDQTDYPNIKEAVDTVGFLPSDAGFYRHIDTADCTGMYVDYNFKCDGIYHSKLRVRTLDGSGTDYLHFTRDWESRGYRDVETLVGLFEWVNMIELNDRNFNMRRVPGLKLTSP